MTPGFSGSPRVFGLAARRAGRVLAVLIAGAAATLPAVAQDAASTRAGDAPTSRSFATLSTDLESADVARRGAAAETLVAFDGDDVEIARALLRARRKIRRELREDPKADLFEICLPDDPLVASLMGPRNALLRAEAMTTRALGVRGGALRALLAAERSKREAETASDPDEFDPHSWSDHGALGREVQSVIGDRWNVGTDIGGLYPIAWFLETAFATDPRSARLYLSENHSCGHVLQMFVDLRLDVVGRWWATASHFGPVWSPELGYLRATILVAGAGPPGERGFGGHVAFFNLGSAGSSIPFEAPLPPNLTIERTVVPWCALEALRTTAIDARAPRDLRRASAALVEAVDDGVLATDPRRDGAAACSDPHAAAVVALTKLAARFVPAADYVHGVLQRLSPTLPPSQLDSALLNAVDADWLADAELVDALRKVLDTAAVPPPHLDDLFDPGSGGTTALRPTKPPPRAWGSPALGTWDFPPTMSFGAEVPARATINAVRFDVDIERRLSDGELAYDVGTPSASSEALPDGGILVTIEQNDLEGAAILVHLKPDAEGRPTARTHVRDSARSPTSQNSSLADYDVVLSHQRFYRDPILTLALVPRPSPDGFAAAVTVVRTRNPLVR